MLILSIDVGIRNLAYLVIDVDELKQKSSIINWDIMELCEKDENACKVDNTRIGIKMNSCMLKLLDKYVFDKVIIENQIGQNAIKMKSIQSMIVMFFVTQNYKQDQIINYNAANKLKHFLGKKKTTYSERKKISKTITHDICCNHYKDWLIFFQACKKKDDLADCLLQALDYCVKNSLLTNEIYDNLNNNVND